MQKQKWYQPIVLTLIVLLLLPLLLLGSVTIIIDVVLSERREKKIYEKSHYHRDFGERYRPGISGLPAYRFYNSAVHRGLPVQPVWKGTDEFQGFFLGGVLYLFPDFDEIDYNEERAEWQVNPNDEWESFDGYYQRLLSELEQAPDVPVRLLVEREMFLALDLSGLAIPDSLFVTWSYENAFENEDSPLKLRIPQNARELYDRMLQTPDLCGRLTFDEGEGKIVWELYETVRVEIGMGDRGPYDFYFDLRRSQPGKAGRVLLHRYPHPYEEIYKDVCCIGKRGNVAVVRSIGWSKTLLYAGIREGCPYLPGRKSFFRNYEYLEAR